MSYTPPGSPPPPPPGGYGYGQPAYPNPGYGAPVVKQSNGVAVASLIIGILSLITVCLSPLGIVAVVLGFVGLGKAKKIGGAGKGMAIGGIVTGILALIVAVLLAVLVVFAADKVDDPDVICGSDETSNQGYPCRNEGSEDPDPDADGINSDPADQVCNVDRFAEDPDC